MRTYKKYNGFIPETYIKYTQQKNSNGDIRLIKLLFILSLAFMPISISVLIENKKEIEKKNTIVEEKVIIDKSEQVLKWIDLIGIQGGQIEILEERGTIRIKDLKELKGLEDNKYLSINNLKYENNEYIVEVNLK